jgi:transcription elongation factor Elf1
MKEKNKHCLLTQAEEKLYSWV